MAKNSDEDKRTYEDILRSYIIELNSKGLDLDYDTLTDNEKLELLGILTDECNKHMRPFVVHVLGYKWYWFHDYWFDAFVKYNIICAIAARGLGKSFFWTQMLTEYMNFIQGGYKSIISSYNDDATKDFLKFVRDDVEKNVFLSAKIPETKSSDWNKSNLEFTNRSMIKGISITSQIRRVHVNYFIADDILNDDVLLAPEEIKKKVYATILPVVEIKRGKFVLVGTKFAEDDIFTFLQEQAIVQSGYHYMELRVELDEKEEKVYFILETEDGVVTKRADTGETNIYDYARMLSLKEVEPNYFYREYGCQIVSDKDVPFPLQNLLESKDKELSYEDVGDKKKIYAGGLDSSNSISKGADETVLMLGHLDPDNYIIPSNVYADNKLISPDRLKEIENRMKLFNYPSVLAEKNSMGQTNIDMINKGNFRLEAFYTSLNSKNDATDHASHMVKNGKVKFPYKLPKDQIKTDKLIHQLSGVKEKKTKTGKRSFIGTTKHDDWYIAFILMVKQLNDKSMRKTRVTSYKREDLRREY